MNATSQAAQDGNKFTGNVPQHHLVKSFLAKAGIKLVDVAARCGVGKPAVSRVVCGDLRSRRIELDIASALAMPIHEVFPAWYAPDGSPIKKRKRYVRAADALARLRELQANAAVSNREAA